MGAGLRLARAFRQKVWDADFPINPAGCRIFYGWIVVLVGTVGVLGSLPGQTIGVSVFTDRLIEDTGLTRTQLSMTYLIGTVLSGLLIPYSGRKLDRIGSRRMAMLAGCGMAAALVLLSFSGWIGSHLGEPGGGLEGICWLGMMVWVSGGFFLLRLYGQGWLTLASRNMIGKWFNRRRGTATAINGLAVSIVFSLSPWVFEQLIREFGWERLWQMMAAMVVLIFVPLAWAFFRDNPEECGLQMDGGDGRKSGRKPNRDLLMVHEFTLPEVLRNRAFWVVSLAMTLQAFFSTAFTFHILSVAEDLQVRKEALLAALVPSALVASVFTVASGWLIDRFRIKWMVVLFCAGMLTASMGLMVAPSSIWLPLFVLGSGITGGTFITVSGTLYPRYFGRKALGAITGVSMAGLVYGSAVAPFAFSLSLDWTGSYRAGIGAVAGLSGLLLAFSFRVDNPQRTLARAMEGTDSRGATVEK